ncbi:MAG: hypothetical protein ACAH80_08365 [Alphaproteobacteria bacterium]
MTYKTSLLLSVAAFALALSAVTASAETVTTKSTTEQVVRAGAKTINLNNFDLNKNGILSTFEVSEMLFKLFDTDTSGAVDSTEFEYKSVLTVAPMEKLTTISYDYDNNGVSDKTQYTFEKFTQDTQLARFDKNKDGLSPHEFVEKTFLEIDSDHNGGTDLVEWRTAYMTRIVPVQVQ